MVQDPRTGELKPGRIEQPMRSVRYPSSEHRSDLRESLALLWRRKWSILAITLLVVGLALFVSGRQTPIYESRASVLVVPADLGSASDAPEVLNMATEAQLMSSVQVAEIVAKNLKISTDPRQLLEELTVDQPSDTEILEISYRDPDPNRAQRLATGFAQGYLQYRTTGATAQIQQSEDKIQRELDALQLRLGKIQTELARLPEDSLRRGSLESEAASLQSLILERQLALFDLPDQVTVGRIIQPAQPASSPVSPNDVIAVGLGLAAGLALGIGLAFLRDRLSQRLRSSEETEEHLGAPILGTIPRVPQWRRRSKPLVITLTHQRSPSAEAYRILRTNVLSVAAAGGAKSIMVTSAYSGEGKSATVANLGVVLAGAGRRVSLVSADLRRPRLQEFFQRDGSVGLSDVLAERLPLSAAVQEITLPASLPTELSSVGLRILPSGRIPEDPAELITTERMSEVLRDLEETSDIVLVDVPPALAVTDALVVAQVAQGVLVVLGPNSVERSSVLAVRQQLEKVGARILGGVLNGPDTLTAQAGYSYY